MCEYLCTYVYMLLSKPYRDYYFLYCKSHLLTYLHTFYLYIFLFDKMSKYYW